MKAVLLMFDTLTRNHLASYGGNAITPNFQTLSEQSVQFDSFYVGSLPCMPARRELHTGRYNFLHRSWGPLEPFDYSMVQSLSKAEIHTHLVTDHKHYWRDGGATYHTKYDSFEFIRGQEGDKWIGEVRKPDIDYSGLDDAKARQRRHARMAQDLVNRSFMTAQEDHYTHRTISAGLEFIERNHDADNWFLQIECFDPHEPFFVPEKYLQQYGCKPRDFDGWVPYYCGISSDEHAVLAKKFYQALVTMCDDYLGRVIAKMQSTGIWEEALFIVCTDHGFLLGEHQWWGKNIMPVYNEIANTPFFIRDPRVGKYGERRSQLAQTIDIPATVLDFFGLPVPESMQGRPLRNVIANCDKGREYGLFGYFGGHVNITDGQHIYMRSPRHSDQKDLFEYTLMPTRIDSPFSLSDLKGIEMHPGFNFTQGTQVMKIPASSTFEYINAYRFGDKLFDLRSDPSQSAPLDNRGKSLELAAKIRDLFDDTEVPPELYGRFALDDLSIEREEKFVNESNDYGEIASLGFDCENRGAYEAVTLLAKRAKENGLSLESLLGEVKETKLLNASIVFFLIERHFDSPQSEELNYQCRLLLRVD